MWTVWLATALAGSPYAGLSGDVRASGTTSMTPDAVIAAFQDLPDATARFPASCATVTGASTDGVNLTWIPSWMHRKVHVTVDEVKPGRRIDWDMASLKGDLGFYLIVEVTPEGDGSNVTMRTPLSVPKWPLRGLFFNKIRPAWASCYVSTILSLDPSATISEMSAPPVR
jgi:hypothetical protein